MDISPTLPAASVPPVRSMAWPLAWCWILLIVYASLYPFSGWRSPSLPWWSIPLMEWSPYWTWRDVLSNLVGYMPLGFLLALGCVRNGRSPHAGLWWAVMGATAAGLLLSWAMETLQLWLPRRVPSRLDWVLNGCGSLLGALVVVQLHRLGALQGWQHWRQHWLLPDARGALVLLLLWLVALLYPTPLPYGLGQIVPRLYAAIGPAGVRTADGSDSPLALSSLPVADSVGVAAGLLVPLLLLFTAVTRPRYRLLVLPWLIVPALLLPTLLQGLMQGTSLAADWLLHPAVRQGVAAALGVALLCLWLPGRMCLWLLLPTLGLALFIINTATTASGYTALLGRWRQAGWIHFYGITHWLALAWPYMALGYVLVRLNTPSFARHGARAAGGQPARATPSGLP